MQFFLGALRVNGRLLELTISLLAATLSSITFGSNFDPDQDRHFVGPNLDQNCLTLGPEV